MSIISEIYTAIMSRMGADVASVGVILSMLIVTLAMSIYEFVVYRVVSHRTMYNRSFHISIMVIPFFIGAIVMALQSSVIITLGTIGALAIIRFRTAVKDPVDMIYILWSVFIGISCGCQLYELCILTSLMVTVVLVLINILSDKLISAPYILIINCEDEIEDSISEIIKNNAKSFRIKSRNYTSKGFDYVYEINTKDVKSILEEIKNVKGITKYSLLEYDNNDVI